MSMIERSRIKETRIRRGGLRFVDLLLRTRDDIALMIQVSERLSPRGRDPDENRGQLAALEEVPRHLFLDNAFLESAYVDKAFPIGEGQTISQPFTVAYQTELLKVSKRSKVLEIGTGSGYQACVLAAMGCRVYTIERQRKLFDRTKKFKNSLPYKINLHFGLMPITR